MGTLRRRSIMDEMNKVPLSNFFSDHKIDNFLVVLFFRVNGACVHRYILVYAIKVNVYNTHVKTQSPPALVCHANSMKIGSTASEEPDCKLLILRAKSNELNSPIMLQSIFLYNQRNYLKFRTKFVCLIDDSSYESTTVSLEIEKKRSKRKQPIKVHIIYYLFANKHFFLNAFISAFVFVGVCRCFINGIRNNNTFSDIMRRYGVCIASEIKKNKNKTRISTVM